MILAAGIESLFIFLLIAGGSALINWLKKRGENSDILTDDDFPSEPRRVPPPIRNAPAPIQTPAKPAKNWEEELRRMLEGAVPTTRTPPPVVVAERKSPPPAPFQSESARPSPARHLPKAFEERFYKAHCNHCDGHIEFPADATDEVTTCPHCHQQTVLRPFLDTRVETLSHQKELSSFNHSTGKYEAASQLSQRVAAHMHAVGHEAVGLTSIYSTKTIWPEVAETRALFQNSKTVRHAVIASLILGPPKALEN